MILGNVLDLQFLLFQKTLTSEKLMELLLLLLIILFLILFIILNSINVSVTSSLFIQLHEKLNNDVKFRGVKSLLNCEDDSPSLNSKILANENFEEYVSFLNSLVNMGTLNSFSKQELETLFGEHSELLKRHQVTRNYIVERNYTKLASALNIKTND